MGGGSGTSFGEPNLGGICQNVDVTEPFDICDRERMYYGEFKLCYQICPGMIKSDSGYDAAVAEICRENQGKYIVECYRPACTEVRKIEYGEIQPSYFDELRQFCEPTVSFRYFKQINQMKEGETLDVCCPLPAQKSQIISFALVGTFGGIFAVTVIFMACYLVAKKCGCKVRPRGGR